MKNGLLRGKRVLVLEDEPIIAMLIAELIEAAGGEADCISALSGAGAVLARGLPDFALLDINIHGQTSFDLARQLTELAVPVIFASGYGPKAVPPDMGHLPAITKPYTLDELDLAFKAAVEVKDQ